MQHEYKFRIRKLKNKSFEIDFIVDLGHAVAEFTNTAPAELELDKLTETQMKCFCGLMCELALLKENKPVLNS